MIKFFRKIRQKLLSENKFSKYLIYAIGEIVLVVLGILIALQLNNLNEEKRTHIKQENYLALIKQEMANNLKTLKADHKTLTSVIESDRTLLDLMPDNKKIDSINEIDLSKLISYAFSKSFSVNFENGALTELISSGSLKDTENDSIRGLLSSWDGKIHGLKEQEKSVMAKLSRVHNFIETNGNRRTLFDQTYASDYFKIKNYSISESNKPLLKSRVFQNILLVHLGTSILLDKMYLNFEKDIVSLVGSIEEELESK